MSHLPQIARLAKSLGVIYQVPASAHDGDDVIEDKFALAVAPRARIFFPRLALIRSEVFSVSRSLCAEVAFKMRQAFEHLVPVLKPSLLKCGGYLGSGFRCVFVSFWAFVFMSGPAFAGYTKAFFSGLVVYLPPERVVLAHEGFAQTLRVSAHHAFMRPSQVMAGTVMQGAADATRNHSSGFSHRHVNTDNGVNSKNNSNVTVESIGVNFEPIRTRSPQGSGVRQVQRLGGEDNDNPPTSAPLERDDIVWAAWRHADASHKQSRANTTDDILNTTPNSPITAAQFSISQYAASVSISGLEELQNAGKEQIIDLLEGRVKVTEAQLMNRIDYDLYQDGTGNGGKNLIGLSLAIPDDPTLGVYGNISRVNYPFWRSRAYSGATDGGAAVAASNIQAYMTSLALQLVLGSEKPDLYIADNTYYGFYVNSLQAIQRVTSEGGGSAGAGFASLKFYGGGMAADVVLGGGINGDVNAAGTDGGATAAHMWAINTNFLFWRPHRRRNFVPIGGDRQSVNQDATIKYIGFAGQLTCSAGRYHGVLIA